MKIHGICLVKNEADILEWAFTEAARWCDAIYVFDNGSTDGTWELVHQLAERMPQIVPFKQDAIPFDNALRGLVFNEYKDRAQPGDWWCRLDADEIYVENPREFLSNVPRQYHVVWAAHLQYYLTEQDLPRFQGEDFERPPTDHVRQCSAAISRKRLGGAILPASSEARMDHGAWPRHLGLVYPQRIRVRHYQHRSPAQIQRRLETRHAAIAAGNLDFPHIVERSWRETLTPEPLAFDTGDGRYEVDESRLPRHLEPTSRRIVKRILHGIGIWP